MPKNNIYLPKENLAKVEEVRELKEEYKTPSFEEFMKTYEDGNLNYDDLSGGDIGTPKGYGPTDRDKRKKSRKKNNDSEYNEQHLIGTLNNRWGTKGDLWDCDKSAVKEGKNNLLNFSTSSEASLGAGGGLLSGGIGGSYYKYDDGDDGSVRVGGLSLGGEIGGGLGGVTAGYSASLDAISASSHGVSAKIGLDGGSNFTAGPGGVEVKAAGFGVSVGKKTGFSTPFGEVAVDTEEACVVQ